MLVHSSESLRGHLFKKTINVEIYHLNWQSFARIQHLAVSDEGDQFSNLGF